MKFVVSMIVAVAVFFMAPAQESQAQFYRGGSGLSISFGSGGFGSPFYGGRYGGFNRGIGWGHPYGFGGSGLSVGYSSFRPTYSYGRSYVRPYYGGYGGYGRGYGGGYRRGCGY